MDIIYVSLFPEENPDDPYVISINGMNGSDSHNFHLRRAFANFFGLYLKEVHKKLPLTDYDFDGHDLIDDEKSGDPFKRQKKIFIHPCYVILPRHQNLNNMMVTIVELSVLFTV